jgi:hypothetical protein
VVGLARLAAGRRLILGVEPTSSAPAARRPRFGAMHRAPRRSRGLRRLGGRSQPGACQPSSPQVATPVVGAGRNLGASLPTREAFEVHGRAAVGPSEPVAVDAAVEEPAVAADLPEGCRPEAHRAGAGMAVGSRNQSLDGMRPPRRWRCRHRTPGPDTGTGHRDRTDRCRIEPYWIKGGAARRLGRPFRRPLPDGPAAGAGPSRHRARKRSHSAVRL